MRFKIFILSSMLLTFVSGVLFYKNLTQFSPEKNVLKLDIDELRVIDLQVTNTTLSLRKNLNSDLSELHEENTRINELLNLVNDINKNTPELKTSIHKIRLHFQEKQKTLSNFEIAIRDLRSSVNSLIPTYNEMEKKNIKFVLDKRDFYRECLLDSYMFLSFSHKENEMRLVEDQKILSQILNFAKAPNPELQKFAGLLETIHKRVKQLDSYLVDLADDSVAAELKIISKYYYDSIQDKNEKTENLLTFTFMAIAVYLLFMVIILRRR